MRAANQRMGGRNTASLPCVRTLLTASGMTPGHTQVCVLLHCIRMVHWWSRSAESPDTPEPYTTWQMSDQCPASAEHEWWCTGSEVHNLHRMLLNTLQIDLQMARGRVKPQSQMTYWPRVGYLRCVYFCDSCGNFEKGYRTIPTVTLWFFRHPTFTPIILVRSENFFWDFTIFWVLQWPWDDIEVIPRHLATTLW